MTSLTLCRCLNVKDMTTSSAPGKRIPTLVSYTLLNMTWLLPKKNAIAPFLDTMMSGNRKGTTKEVGHRTCHLRKLTSQPFLRCLLSFSLSLWSFSRNLHILLTTSKNDQPTNNKELRYQATSFSNGTTASTIQSRRPSILPRIFQANIKENIAFSTAFTVDNDWGSTRAPETDTIFTSVTWCIWWMGLLCWCHSRQMVIAFINNKERIIPSQNLFFKIFIT